MITSRSILLKAAALLGLSLAALGSAHARDNVYWSVGVDAAPGVSVGVSNHRQPVYVQPQPVYVAPQPVYVQPQTVYVQPQSIYAQPRVIYPGPVYYVQPTPVYYGPPGHWKHGHGHGHGHGGRHWK
jgi:hypothetical protein